MNAIAPGFLGPLSAERSNLFHPGFMGDHVGLWHPSMVILEMVYSWVRDFSLDYGEGPYLKCGTLVLELLFDAILA